MTEIIKVFTDGGSRGNPGKSACAFVVYKGVNIIKQDAKYLGIVTNNYAEYSGVLFALSWLLGNQTLFENLEFHFYLDSELVVKQLNGQYRIKNKELLGKASEIQELIKTHKLAVSFTAVRREFNKLADKLVNMCLDAQI